VFDTEGIWVIFIGCAGWSLRREHWPEFPADGTHLQRYAARFNSVEINSSFYRPHRRSTYERWADSVPEGFRFSVKIPKQISHERRLLDCEDALDEFLSQCSGLGDRLGCLLLQLPPSLAFDAASTEAFFKTLRQRFDGAVVLEPRHESWVSAEPLLMAGRAFVIGGCTVHRAFITVPTRSLICKGSPKPCRLPIRMASRPGAFSTTLPVVQRQATR
jgi:uncharacterized protein YecE (DUF72 family)